MEPAAAEGVDAAAEEGLGFHAINPEAGVVISNYIPGCFCCPDFSTDISSVAIIACLGARSLVAFPGECWDKKVKDRKLPPGTLEKAILVRLAGCADEREIPQESFTVNVWIGWRLKAGFDQYIDFTSGPEATYSFLSRETADLCLPFAQAVVDVANEKFALNDLLNPTPVESRMSIMEAQIDALRAGMDELLALQRHSSGDGGFQSAQENPVPRRVTKLHLRPQGARADAAPEGKTKEAAMELPPGLPNVFDFPGLDPSAVAAARQAGVPDAQLKRMAQALAAKPGKLEDYPRPHRPEAEALFADSDVEEADAGLEAAVQDNGDPVAQSLVKLTSIVNALAKKKETAQDEVVDGLASGVGSADSGSSLGDRKSVV